MYINSFCLMSSVLFLFGTDRWTNDKRMKQGKSYLKIWRHRISPIRLFDVKAKLVPLPCELRERGWINCQKYIID